MGIWYTPQEAKDQFIRKIIQAEHCKPHEALYIGDIPEDLELVQAGGILFIGRELKILFCRVWRTSISQNDRYYGVDGEYKNF